MSIFIDALKGLRSSLENPATPLYDPAAWVVDGFGERSTDAGISVSPSGALACIAVSACVSTIGESIAQLPWDVYRINGKKRAVAKDRTEHYLLHCEPIGTMSSYSFRLAVMASVLLYGNAYVELLRDGANRVRAMRPLPSWMVRVFENEAEDRLIYQVTRRNGTQELIDGSDIVHVPCLSLDGIAGLSPISQHRQAVGLALAAETAGASFFGNGSRPSGYLSVDNPLKADQREDLERKWFAHYGGARNTGKVPVLSGGLKWQQLSMSPQDAQYIETRKFQVEDIARMYRVPAVLIGAGEKTASYASSRELFDAFRELTLAPWAQALEQEFNRKLFPNTDELYCKLDLNGLMRGDAKGRAEFYKSLWSIGALSQNEARDWEEMDPVEGGDRYFVQQGFVPLDKVDQVIDKQGSKPSTPGGFGGANDGGGDGQNADQAQRAVHVAWLSDVLARIVKWEKKDSVRVAEAVAPVLRSLAEQCGWKGSIAERCAEVATDDGFAASQAFAEQVIDGLLNAAKESQ